MRTQRQYFRQRLQLLLKEFPEDISNGCAYELLSTVYRQLKNQSQEQVILEQWIERDNDALSAQLRLLEIYAEQENWQELARVAELTLAVNPLLTSSQQHLAAAVTAMKQPQRSIAPLQALLALDPRDPADVHYRLARSLQETGKHSLARRHVLQALEFAPRYRDAHRLLLELAKAPKPVKAETKNPSPPGSNP